MSKVTGGIIRSARARVIGLLLLLAGFVVAVSGQKATHPDIKQLQGPQDPRIGFLLQVRTPAAATSDQGKAYLGQLRVIGNVANTTLRQGVSGEAVLRRSSRALALLPEFTGEFGMITLDKKGRMTAAGSDTKSGGFCAASSFHTRGTAKLVCADVEQRAMTVQAAVNAAIGKEPDASPIAMDRFGNMAFSTSTKGMFRVYIGGDGKVVVEAGN